jgi:exopolyphosphatase/guanosine-5'-triphosphate,3'-diphosphate pyrophosphatase
MPRYAALDIGSNSVRMLAADIDSDGRFQILAEDRQVTRLGSSVFQSGQIGSDALDFVCENLVRMAQVYRKLDVAAVRAVATSAVRDAGNQAEFLDRASKALGAPVEIISGPEEARLIHLGVQLRWPQPGKNVLIIDVGGGSAEVISSQDCRLLEAYSKPLGAVRLTEVFLRSDPPTDLELHRLDKYIEEKLRTPARKIGQGAFHRVIATSATAAAIVCAINRIPRPKRESADRLRAGVGQLRAFYNDLRSRDLRGRRRILGIGPRRAELIVAGTAVFLRCLEMFKQRSLCYSAAGVRDGVIADLAARGVGRDHASLSREQRQTVEQTARRYGVQVPHARKVAVLALRLFESLQPLHKLAAPFGKLLEASAYLHDIGHFVSDTSHHKHSYYLVAHSDLPGFTDFERQLIALLCRYHRKTMPAPRHAPFQSIDPDSRRAVTLLAPLLRIADSLDRSHDQSVDDMAVQLKNGNVVVAINSDADTDLDIWAAENTADVFRDAYQIPLVVAKWKR